jgi:hypothetical protein
VEKAINIAVNNRMAQLIPAGRYFVATGLLHLRPEKREKSASLETSSA